MSIQPLSNHILFRIKDIAKSTSVLLPDGVARQQAAEVLAVGPKVDPSILPGDLCILIEGVTFSGYLHDGATAHLITDNCVVGKYVGSNPIVLN